MRTTISIYRQLGKFIEVMDAEAQTRGEGPEDKTLDPHFRSGVYLGVGMSNIILSLMPGKLLTIVELFGYKGDRHAGLAMLMKAGGWSKDSWEPSISPGTLIFIYSIVILTTNDAQPRRAYGERSAIWPSLSSIWFFRVSLSKESMFLWPAGFSTGISNDIQLVRTISLHGSLLCADIVQGVFFLFGAGRLSLVRSQPRRAIEFYNKAMTVQARERILRLTHPYPHEPSTR